LSGLSTDDILPNQQSNLYPLSTYFSQPTFSCEIAELCFYITMSFGFSVGDFVAVLQLANTIHERFLGAPEQFKAISNE
jgi:hypothetical protein